MKNLLDALVGNDAARNKETLFLTLSLEFGVLPKPLESMRVRHGGKKAAVPIKVTEPDLHYAVRFAELANQCGVPCDGETQFKALYEEYRQWYARHYPDVQ